MMTAAPTIQELPFAIRLQVLLGTMRSISEGRDETIRALQAHVAALGTRAILVGGVAVILSGYERTTDDRDVLVDYRDVQQLADRLMDDPRWERLETRKYAFRYRPTGILVDFLVSRDLMKLGLPYYFPDVDQLESAAEVEAMPVVGLHDLLFFKMIAGRLQDLADVMELCKRHLEDVDPNRVIGRLKSEDHEIAERFQEILRNAPRELAEERRLGQQDSEDRVDSPAPVQSVYRQRGCASMGARGSSILAVLWPLATMEVAVDDLTVRGVRLKREQVTSLRVRRGLVMHRLQIETHAAHAPRRIVFWSSDLNRLKTELAKRGWRVEES